MASAPARQLNSKMAESLTNVLSQTLEKFVYEEEVSDSGKDSNLSKPSVHEVRPDAVSKPPTSSEHMDVDGSVDALLTDVKEHDTDKQSKDEMNHLVISLQR
ncbi:hypothetical protein OS493_000384 [Desmophyllum pertusum]|uniref:Uncharacterized protein n=1 Tax=Desmophyllum pertusum TaxID=174260 RepID=A0A9X0A7H0_9CNID|nr:hypothetical protein OS493_000384 [Desmophyllum pertusum]